MVARTSTWQRLLLLLAVVIGLGAMHVVWTTPEHASVAAATSTAAAVHTAVAGPVHGASGEVLPSVANQIRVQEPHAASGHSPMPADRGLSPLAADKATHPVGSDLSCLLVHLCLAILAGAVLVLAALLRVLIGRTATTEVTGTARQLVERACTPPPPTSIRLAQLCVLRT